MKNQSRLGFLGKILGSGVGVIAGLSLGIPGMAAPLKSAPPLRLGDRVELTGHQWRSMIERSKYGVLYSYENGKWHGEVLKESLLPSLLTSEASWVNL